MAECLAKPHRHNVLCSLQTSLFGAPLLRPGQSFHHSEISILNAQRRIGPNPNYAHQFVMSHNLNLATHHFQGSSTVWCSSVLSNEAI